MDDKPLEQIVTVGSTTPDEHVVYEIVDTEHPENNAVIDPSAVKEETPEEREARREIAFQRAAHAARILLAEKINKKREKENLRALKGRIKSRRKKEKLAKASRKRNR